jgi:hypothetical protein
MKKTSLLLVLFTILFSCDKLMPGGLWDHFETDLRIEKQSDQGPWGGTRTYYWKSSACGYFSQRKVFEYASSHGWSLVDSIKYQKQEIENLRTNNKPIFIVQAGPFEPPSEVKFLEHDFPRCTNTGLTLYKFKTGWLIFYPGTDSATEINGFITISEDKMEMTVYHLWGE